MMKKIILIILLLIVLVVVVFAIYFYMQKQNKNFQNTSTAIKMPETNPFAVKVNPMDGYTNPFAK